MTATQKRFLAASISAQVQAVTPIARELVFEGVDLRNFGDDDVTERVEGLIGHCGPAQDNPQPIMEAMHAAYVLGIAVGQLLSPDVFKKGAGR